jgi:hypothetical protein
LKKKGKFWVFLNDLFNFGLFFAFMALETNAIEFLSGLVHKIQCYQSVN